MTPAYVSQSARVLLTHSGPSRATYYEYVCIRLAAAVCTGAFVQIASRVPAAISAAQSAVDRLTGISAIANSWTPTVLFFRFLTFCNHNFFRALNCEGACVRARVGVHQGQV